MCIRDRFITSQNHGYVVDKLPKDVEVTYTHVNDGSIEGMRVRDKKIYTVQFHPEEIGRAHV